VEKALFRRSITKTRVPESLSTWPDALHVDLIRFVGFLSSLLHYGIRRLCSDCFGHGWSSRVSFQCCGHYPWGLLSECHLLVLFSSPYQTLVPNGPNGSVVRVEKPVVLVQTVMIELVRTLPHPELQTSRDNYVGCGLVDHTESR
ncbi:hypothetical protein Dimus_005145, partial [Dionaea muscipula]